MEPRTQTAATRIAIAFAALQLLLHFVVNARGGYGYFRDEFYYIACSEHLAAGYVDHPPLSIFLLALQRACFGDSLFALRLLPALAGAATVFLTGRLAMRLGAGPVGVAIASLACAVSPTILGTTGTFSMNAFDLLVWIGAAHLLANAIERPSTRAWIALGFVLGLGLLNKIDVAWSMGGIAIGLLATPQRAQIATRGPWLAGGLAVALFLPYVIWNATHDWAHLEFIRRASEGKYAHLDALGFLAGQIPAQHPLAAPLWIAGLLFLFAAKDLAIARPLGWIWLTTCALLVFNGTSKVEYLSCAFPILFAAGGAAVERVRRGWFRFAALPAYAALLFVTGLALAPFAIPILPVETFVRYQARLGVAPSTSENKKLGALPQHYADMFGWRKQVAAVAAAWNALSDEDRADCAIYASNYGRCGAIDFLGKPLGLPDSIGGHNNDWIWGPRAYTGRVMLVLTDDMHGNEALFEQVEVVAHAEHDEYAMPYETDLAVYLCRGLVRPLAEQWPLLRHYD